MVRISIDTEDGAYSVSSDIVKVDDAIDIILSLLVAIYSEENVNRAVCEKADIITFKGE